MGNLNVIMYYVAIDTFIQIFTILKGTMTFLFYYYYNNKFDFLER